MDNFAQTLHQLADEVQTEPDRFNNRQRHWARLFLDSDESFCAATEFSVLRASFPAPFALAGWYQYFESRAVKLSNRSAFCELDSECIAEIERLKKRNAAFAGTYRVTPAQSYRAVESKKNRMTIGVDLRPLSIPSSRNRGIGRYLINTLPSLIENAPQHRFVLLSDPSAKKDDELLSLFKRSDLSFRDIGVGCDHDLDLFLLTDPTPMLTGRRLSKLPITQCAWVSIVYDFIPLEYPELYLRGSEQLIDEYLENIQLIGNRCQAVFPISRYVAKQCEGLLGLSAEQVIPIFGGVDESFFDASPLSKLREYPEPYFLYVGGADARKNIAGLIKAFVQASAELPSEWKLVLVGEMNAERTNTTLREMHLDDYVGRIIGLGGIDDQRLRGLYANALATVFVSHSEGLGLPALEAMATGCPVIASRTTALGETVGTTGVLVDPASTLDIAQGMILIAKDASLRLDLAIRGPIHARKWRWDDVATALLGGIEKHVTNEVHAVPRKRRMRVAMMNRENVWTAPGGDSRIMLQMQEAATLTDIEVFFPSSVEQASSADLIHFVNMTLPHPLREAARFARQLSIPFLITTLYEDWSQYLNVSHQAFGLYRAYVSGQLSRLSLETMLQGLHAVQPALRVDVTESLRQATLLLACADSEAARLNRDYPELSDRVMVVPFEASVPELTEQKTSDSMRKALGFEEFVLCIGRLETRKNQLAVLAALQDVDIPIVFAAGDYTPQPVYAQTVRGWRRKAPVTFVDRMPWHLMSALIRSASVHVLPSFYELPGLVHLECAAAGIPIVASDWGAISDYLPHSMFHVCDPLDLVSIRTATLNAMSRPLPPATADIAKSYTQSRLAENLTKNYERALNSQAHNTFRNKQSANRPLKPEVTGGIHAAV